MNFGITESFIQEKSIKTVFNTDSNNLLSMEKLVICVIIKMVKNMELW